MGGQTFAQVNAIKAEIFKLNQFPENITNLVHFLRLGMEFKSVGTGESFSLVEIQLKGVLLDFGIRRVYVSYNDLLDEYSTPNGGLFV